MQGRPMSGMVAKGYKATSFFVAFFAVILGLFAFSAGRASAATAAGTSILNTSAASYEDANNNVLAALSNTLSTTVQNAPTLTVGAPAAQNVTPAMVALDAFTLTNTGNAVGTFALPSDATFSGTATGTNLVGYVIGSLASGTCSFATPCTGAVLNGLAAMTGIAATTGSVAIGVVYSVSANAATGSTIQTTLTATVTYAAATGAAAETSANATAAAPPTDTAIVDARLDVEAVGTVSGSNIVWTITANNGGASTAQGLASAKTMLGAANNGIPIFIPVPVFSGTPLVLQAAPSAPTIPGASGGAAAAVYYNATACSSSPNSGWSTTYVNNAKCIAAYVSNSTPSVLPSQPGGSTGAGAVLTPQLSFSFTTNQPSGPGSGNANAVTLVASSAIGGASWVTPAVPILGQGVAVGASQDSATASLLNLIEADATSSSGIFPPGGASNQAQGSGSGSSTPAYSLVNGPFSAPGATGLYPGASGSATNMLDFTALNVPCTSNGSAGVNGASCTVNSVIIVNQVQNTGTSSDGITITATAPSGFTAALYNVTGCTGGGASVPVGCTQGSALSGSTTVASGATFDYEVVYAASGNVTPFTPYTTKLTATGTGDANDTYNVLYPGGVVQLTNGVVATATNCPPGESAPPSGLACPGGTLSYTVQYANVVPANVALNLGTEPLFASNPCYTKAGTLMIADDGSGGPPGATSANNWATTTNGIAAAATDSVPGGGGATIFTYSPSGLTAYSASQTKFVAQIGGSSYQLAPGVSGTITFTAVVK